MSSSRYDLARLERGKTGRQPLADPVQSPERSAKALESAQAEPAPPQLPSRPGRPIQAARSRLLARKSDRSRNGCGGCLAMLLIVVAYFFMGVSVNVFLWNDISFPRAMEGIAGVTVFLAGLGVFRRFILGDRNPAFRWAPLMPAGAAVLLFLSKALNDAAAKQPARNSIAAGAYPGTPIAAAAAVLLLAALALLAIGFILALAPERAIQPEPGRTDPPKA